MKIRFDAGAIATGYGISVDGLLKSWTGATLSGIMEERVASLVNGERMGDKQLPYDVIAKDRSLKKIEVRNLMASAANWAPSTATGVNRKFCEEAFYDKVESCDSYVFCDLRDVRVSSEVTIYEITAEETLDMYEKVRAIKFCKTKRREDVAYYMSNNASMTQKRFFERFPYEEYAFVV